MAEFSTTPAANGDCVLTVAGEVDIACVGDFLAAADACAESSGRIEVDLGGVTFIDSSGLGTLVRIRNQAHERGARVVLTRVPAHVTRLLEVTGLAEAFGPQG